MDLKSQNVNLTIIMKNQMTTLVIKGVDKEFKKKISKIAKEKGMSVSTLASIWFTEKLQTA